MKRLGLRQRTLLLSAVPLGFLVLLLGSALFLQWRNAVETDESRNLTALLSHADQAAVSMDRASRSVLAFDGSHNSFAGSCRGRWPRSRSCKTLCRADVRQSFASPAR
jgi:hypothetical protein